MDLSLQARWVFGEVGAVIVVVLSVAVLGLFVLSMTSWFLGNRREKS